MTILSKSAAYLGLQKPVLPDVDSHYTSGDDYWFQPNWQALSLLLNPIKAPLVTVKKVRKLQRDRTAEEDY